MNTSSHILTDRFDRKHTYLRISLTERCNLRCTYCMPAEGIALKAKQHLMTTDEIETIANTFVNHGVSKIRLTGGEPMVRKDFPEVVKRLSRLPIDLHITSNGVLADKHIDLFKETGIKELTISLDTLCPKKFHTITRRNEFHKVWENIKLLQDSGIKVKLNIVLVKGFNDAEIIDFIALTKHQNITIRFIEFMPFDGNQWDKSKLVSEQFVLDTATYHYPLQLERLQDAPNDTSRNYKITNHIGKFSIISSVTNPFCDTCNRIRLTADGKLKNCLFSDNEVSLLTALRNNQPIEPLIQQAMLLKFKTRGGMDTSEKIENPKLHSQNRSMIAIGG